jgi:hypothetical protein
MRQWRLDEDHQAHRALGGIPACTERLAAAAAGFQRTGRAHDDRGVGWMPTKARTSWELMAVEIVANSNRSSDVQERRTGGELQSRSEKRQVQHLDFELGKGGRSNPNYGFDTML